MTTDELDIPVWKSDATVTAHEIETWLVVGVMTGSPWRENCYIVIDRLSSEAVIVDPGWEADLILAEVRQRGAIVRNVILTHGHHDHVGAVTPICEALGIRCFIGEQDTRLVRHAPLYSFRFSGRHFETPKPVSAFANAEHSVGNTSIRVHSAPGHTKGGVVFEFPGFALTGDTLLYKHVGRTDLPGGDASMLRTTIDHLLTVLDANVLLLAGHGRPWKVAEARAWWSTARNAPATLDSFVALDE